MTWEEIEIRHDIDNGGSVDIAFAEDAVQHPETCCTEADYPGWTPAMGCCKAPQSTEEEADNGA